MTRVPAAERRQMLREAAWRVMLEHGPEAATTRAICAEAGMPQSAFHYCFSSRDELLSELIAEMLPRELAAATSTVVRTGTTAGAIERALLAYWELVEAEPRAHLVIHEVTAGSLRDPQRKEQTKTRYAQYLAAVQVVMAGIAEAREITWDRSPAQLAHHVVALLNGLTVQYLIDGDAQSARTALSSFARDLADHSRRIRPAAVRART